MQLTGVNCDGLVCAHAHIDYWSIESAHNNKSKMLRRGPTTAENISSNDLAVGIVICFRPFLSLKQKQDNEYAIIIIKMVS